MSRFPFSRRSLLGLGLSLGLLAALPAQAETQLRIGYQKSSTLISLLKSQGTLEKALADQDIRVSWHEFASGQPLLEALNVGNIDLSADVADTVPVFAQAAGADLLYVAHEPPAPTSEAILVPKDSSLKSVSELKGKKIALNKGSNVHYLLVRALEDAGLKYSDIQPVYLPPADARAAFERGSVDVWVIWDPFQAAAEHQLQARTLRNGEGLVANHQFYLAARPYAEKHPEVVSVLVEEIRGIGEWTRANSAEATAQVAPLLGLSPEITRTAVERQAYGAQLITPDVVEAQQQIADTFSDLKLIPKRLSIKDVIWTPPAKVASAP